jgi:hypothetical protein
MEAKRSKVDIPAGTSPEERHSYDCTGWQSNL